MLFSCNRTIKYNPSAVIAVARKGSGEQGTGSLARLKGVHGDVETNRAC
jgi:hypothetical protein